MNECPLCHRQGVNETTLHMLLAQAQQRTQPSQCTVRRVTVSSDAMRACATNTVCAIRPCSIMLCIIVSVHLMCTPCAPHVHLMCTHLRCWRLRIAQTKF